MKEVNKIFIGFDYTDFFIDLFDKKIKPWLAENSIEVLFPIDRNPGGDLINRIFSMIRNGNLTIFDCTTVNPNVVYELGYAIGSRLPFFILYNSKHEYREELPQILKTQWGIWYDSFDSLKTHLEFSKKKYFEKGFYDHRTNELLTKKVGEDSKINSIQIIVDSQYNYEEEIGIIFNHFDQSEITVSQIERYISIEHLFEEIKNETIIISVLSQSVHKNDIAYSQINKLNALKLLAIGIARALKKTVFLFNRGNVNYSDIFDLSIPYHNRNEFEKNLNTLNKQITLEKLKGIRVGKRVGIPNFGKLIKRNKLTRFITKNILAKKIFLRAPSGYGKSAIAINVSKEIDYKTIWYTFDEKILSVSEIIKDIILEFSKLDSNIGLGLSSILNTFAKSEISEDVFVGYFLNEINKICRPILLIIDDVHFSNKKFPLFIDRFISYSFSNIRIILLSREDLDISIDDKFKHIISIQKDEIKFTEEEIYEFFQTNYDLTLSPVEVSILMQKTEGWIAGISLLQSIFVKSGNEGIKEIIKNLKGTNKKIYDYFAEIVYDNFDSNVQNILRHTSVLRVISPKIFQFLFGASLKDSQKKLTELEKQNSFLFTYENEPDIYYFHLLFKEFLYKKYKEIEGENKIEEDMFNISNFYFDKDEYFDAINLGLESKNYSVVVKVINRIGNQLVNENYGDLLLHWIPQIPSSFYEKDFEFYLINGRSFESTSNFENAKLSYEKAKEILSKTNNEKEKNRVEFFLMNSSTINIRKISGEDKILSEIIAKAKFYKDEETFFHASGLLFQMKRTCLLTDLKADNQILEEARSILNEIEVVISELKYSNLNSKTLYLSQVLIDKAMIAHHIDWLCASNYLFELKLAKYTSNAKNSKNVLDFFKNSQIYFEEALKLAEENKYELIVANILVNRAQIYSSTNVFYYFNFEFLEANFINQSIEDLTRALSIYISMDKSYNVAVTYNNLANTFLLIDDKQNRNKFANLAIEIATKNNYNVVLEKSREILQALSIQETHLKKLHDVNDLMHDFSFSNEQKNDIANRFIERLGSFSKEEFDHRKQIFLSEMDDLKKGREIKKNWCKHFFLFDTNNPLNIHESINESMIESYLNCDAKAQELHDLHKDLFKHRSAKFIHCKKVNIHSPELSDDVNNLANKFIGTFCNNCNQREY